MPKLYVNSVAFSSSLIICFIIEKLARYADDYNVDQNEIDQLKSDYKGKLVNILTFLRKR